MSTRTPIVFSESCLLAITLASSVLDPVTRLLLNAYVRTLPLARISTSVLSSASIIISVVTRPSALISGMSFRRNSKRVSVHSVSMNYNESESEMFITKTLIANLTNNFTGVTNWYICIILIPT